MNTTRNGGSRGAAIARALAFTRPPACCAPVFIHLREQNPRGLRVGRGRWWSWKFSKFHEDAGARPLLDYAYPRRRWPYNNLFCACYPPDVKSNGTTTNMAYVSRPKKERLNIKPKIQSKSAPGVHASQLPGAGERGTQSRHTHGCNARRRDHARNECCH